MKKSLKHVVLIVCAYIYMMPMCFADSFLSLEGFPQTKQHLVDYTEYLQEKEIFNHPIQEIIYPVFTFPALLTEKDRTFSIIFSDHISHDSDVLISLEKNGRKFVTIFPDSIKSVGKNLMQIRAGSEVFLPVGIYDLVLFVDGIAFRSDHSVAFTDAHDLSFIILADPQIEDLQSKRTKSMDYNNKLYPGHSNALLDYSRQFGILGNAVSLINHSDNDFVMSVGDLVFGIDYQREYEHLHHFLMNLEVPIFAVPGNHDGYAKFSHQDDFFSPLEYDGLNYWRNFLGPVYYAFQYDDFVFMMLNTYDGSAERRASGKPIGIGDNAAVPVSNYGGFLSDDQRGWVDAMFEKHTIFSILSHHTPIGDMENNNYFTPHDRFPKNSIIGAVIHEEWNIETAQYDSDISDLVSLENGYRNTGTAVLEHMVEQELSPWYFSGHTHMDRTYVFEKDQEIIPGSELVASGVMHFITTSTVSSSGEDYFGVREVTVDSMRRIDYNYICEEGIQCRSDSDDAKGFQSTPLGNFWVSYRFDNAESQYIGGNGSAETVSAEIVNYLPTKRDVLLRFLLPARKNGYQLDTCKFDIVDAFIAEDSLIYLLVKGSIDAGTDQDKFFKKSFSAEKEVMTVSPNDETAPVPEIVVDETVDYGFIDISVKNDRDFFHLVWLVDNIVIGYGEKFSGKITRLLGEHFLNKENNFILSLQFVDENGGGGTIVVGELEVPRVKDEYDNSSDKIDFNETDDILVYEALELTDTDEFEDHKFIASGCSVISF